MAYTTVVLVQSMFRKLSIGAGTVITSTEVDQFILEADAEIDAKLTRYYEVPVTGAESLKIVGTISRNKVAHLIKTILEVDSQKSELQQDVQTNLEKKAEALLQDLLPQFNARADRWEEPIMPLPDATTKPTAPGTANQWNSHTLNDDTKKPQFKKGGLNW